MSSDVVSRFTRVGFDGGIASQMMSLDAPSRVEHCGEHLQT